MIKKYKITLANKERELIIIKKKKKNISLQVKPSMEIILSIPMRISYSYGLKLIEEKSAWIEEKLEKYSSASNNSGTYYLGKLYSVKIKKSEIPIKVVGENIIANNSEGFDLLLNEWYQQKIKRILEIYLEKYTKLMELYPKKIKIKPLKSAWGICYSSGTITFNLNLVKVPLNVIEYLVVHELGHLKHPNHSNEYWEYIGKYIENPKSYRRWLKKNGYKFI
ncbi:M48 family metallopeptidase [Psychrilyobacter atlanticus]|uniref:M48 family metallopeptidase n=1 Tax=Psychrilyobacter atlanticus TaxID=271091 RepID=UPI0003FF824D|nr:YgjP-like metallopeptidase domain-containing protein [Psychrilyobacter atlanticus]